MDLVVLALAGQSAAILRAVHRVDVALPSSAPGDTWVIVGTDDRSQVPAGADPGAFGTIEDAPGVRADVVVVVHRTASGDRALSLPRDVLVVDGQGRLSRLALALAAGGPQSVVDGLCRTLGIPVDHLVQVDFQGFAAAVDALGGVEVQLGHPIRDANTGLDQPAAGAVAMDGVTALSYVRSRHAEELIDGTWRPEVDGAVGRATRILDVLTALRTAGQDERRDPLAARRVAVALAPHLTLDRHTSPVDLLRLVSSRLQPEVLPTSPVDGSLARSVGDDGGAVLARAGFTQPCSPPRR